MTQAADRMDAMAAALPSRAQPSSLGYGLFFGFDHAGMKMSNLAPDPSSLVAVMIPL